MRGKRRNFGRDFDEQPVEPSEFDSAILSDSYVSTMQVAMIVCISPPMFDESQ
jgi:hypothetical protein